MFLSQLFTKTAKDAATDADSVNAALLTRAGFIHKTMAGVYAFLPLGLRVLQRIEMIVREEMDTIGTEILMNALSPRTCWEKTGRDQVDNAFEVRGANDRSRRLNDSSYILSFSHEELVTPLVQSFSGSYKDLPVAVYQIQTKFRNEPRPKAGLLRGREFRMKDLYSFHSTEEDMLEYFHQKAIPAYTRIFERLGIGAHTVIALASGGIFSKEKSREFQTICDSGEDLIFHVPGSQLYFNREITPSQAPLWQQTDTSPLPLKEVKGAGIIGVDELAGFLGIEVERTTKTLLLETDTGKTVAVCVRGGYEVNTEKLCSILECQSVHMLPPDAVRTVTGAEPGYAGPIGLPESVQVIWDESCAGRLNFECGANRTDYHSVNVNFGRDLPQPIKFFDVKMARSGDRDPASGQVFETFKGSEVGNVFTLYRKYSDAFSFTFTDRSGEKQPVYMGCYGLGTSRVMGVIAEVCHDDLGLRWPAAVAPADYHLVPIARETDDAPYQETLHLKKRLEAAGKTVLCDDRLHLSVGARLADADLIGVPVRVLLSPKTLTQGMAEVKDRLTGAVTLQRLDEIGKP